MADAARVPGEERSIGALLQSWRRARRLSQLALAVEAGVSARHLSFVETGRARPSREMVLRLAGALDVPLREQNELLLAAGLAPEFLESKLDAPSLASVQSALDAILHQQEPFPAVVMNRAWDILRANDAGTRFFGLLLADAPGKAPSNVLRLMFDPKWVRPHVANWQAVAGALLARVRRESVAGVPDAVTRRLLAELAEFPGVAELLRDTDPAALLVPVLPVTFAKAGHRFDFFSTVTKLGTPQDVTLQEIRIECFFPANRETELRAREMLAPPTAARNHV